MNFHCECGSQIPVDQNPDLIHVHMHACPVMQQSYGQLYSTLGVYNQKMSENSDQRFICNVLALLSAYQTDVIKTFNVYQPPPQI